MGQMRIISKPPASFQTKLGCSLFLDFLGVHELIHIDMHEFVVWEYNFLESCLNIGNKNIQNVISNFLFWWHLFTCRPRHSRITSYNPRALVSVDQTSSAIIHQILACRASLLSYHHLTLDRTNYAMGRWALIVHKTRLQRIICFRSPAPITLTPPPGGVACVSHTVNSRSRWAYAKQLRLALIMWLSCRRWCAVFC